MLEKEYLKLLTAIYIEFGFFIFPRIWTKEDLLSFNSNLTLECTENNTLILLISHSRSK